MLAALQTGLLVNQTKQVSFLLHFECFTLPWQPRLPGGSSKTPPHTATKEVHLARLLPGMSWPTLKPSLHNQQAELVWPSFTSHPASHHILSPQTRLGRSTEGLRHLKNVLAVCWSIYTRLKSWPHLWLDHKPHMGTAGDCGHLGHLDGCSLSMAQIGIEGKHASVH